MCGPHSSVRGHSQNQLARALCKRPEKRSCCYAEGTQEGGCACYTARCCKFVTKIHKPRFFVKYKQRWVLTVRESSQAGFGNCNWTFGKGRGGNVGGGGWCLGLDGRCRAIMQLTSSLRKERFSELIFERFFRFSN